MERETGYYWGYRKGSPIGEIVYYHDGYVYDIVHVVQYGPNEMEHGIERLELDDEPLSLQKWTLGEKVQYEKRSWFP